MRHIGLLGGTFDPIHNGHLHLATTVLQLLTLDAIRLIPCYHTVHREQPIATPEQRLTMTCLACQGQLNIQADDTELKRGGSSYMIDTLKTIKQSQENLQLYLIIGYDAFMNFTTWKDWQAILELCHVIVARRPHYSNQNETTTALIKQYGTDYHDIKSYPHGKISILEINALSISSTTIRQAIKKNKDVSDKLPNQLYQFIKQEGLYAK